MPDAERPGRAVEPDQTIVVATAEVADASKAPARTDGTDKDVLVEACAGRVCLPFRERVSVLPDKIALAVAVEVAEAGQRPSGSDGAVNVAVLHKAGGGQVGRGVGCVPNCEDACASVAPDEIGGAITIEVHAAHELPAWIHEVRIDIRRKANARGRPRRDLAAGLAPKQIADAIGVEVVGPWRARHQLTAEDIWVDGAGDRHAGGVCQLEVRRSGRAREVAQERLVGWVVYRGIRAVVQV